MKLDISEWFDKGLITSEIIDSANNKYYYH